MLLFFHFSFIYVTPGSYNIIRTPVRISVTLNDVEESQPAYNPVEVAIGRIQILAPFSKGKG